MEAYLNQKCTNFAL